MFYIILVHHFDLNQQVLVCFFICLQQKYVIKLVFTFNNRGLEILQKWQKL